MDEPESNARRREPARRTQRLSWQGRSIIPFQLVISFLSEGWPADAPSIIVVNDDGTLSPIASGLPAVVSIGYGPDGSVNAVQLSDDFETLRPQFGHPDR